MGVALSSRGDEPFVEKRRCNRSREEYTREKWDSCTSMTSLWLMTFRLQKQSRRDVSDKDVSNKDTENGAIITSILRMRWHNWINRLVPNMFMVTESFRASSNLTVAAEWKTTDTDRINVSWSVAEMPNCGSVTSPAIGMIFKSSSGESRLSLSNSCRTSHRRIVKLYSMNLNLKIYITAAV